MVNENTWCQYVEMLIMRFKLLSVFLSSWMVLHHFSACSLHYLLFSPSYRVGVMDSNKLIFQTASLALAATYQETASYDVTLLHANSPVLCFHRVYSLLYILHNCYYIILSYWVSSVLCPSSNLGFDAVSLLAPLELYCLIHVRKKKEKVYQEIQEKRKRKNKKKKGKRKYGMKN